MQRDAQDNEKENEKEDHSHDEQAEFSQAALELVLFGSRGETRSNAAKDGSRTRRSYFRLGDPLTTEVPRKTMCIASG